LTYFYILSTHGLDSMWINMHIIMDGNGWIKKLMDRPIRLDLWSWIYVQPWCCIIPHALKSRVLRQPSGRQSFCEHEKTGYWTSYI